MEAPIPKNEASRLEALYQYEILDTLPEQVYDDITFLASHICGMPISAISLIDKNRQWFKSIKGLDAKETPRSVAFCAHAILDSQTLVVNDATKDNRFVDNQLVTEDPRIRFYAGAPIITPDGQTVGTLCVIDQKINSLEPAQLQALEALARQVAMLLQMRLIGLKALKEEAQRAILLEKELLLDNTAAGIVYLKNRIITRCNPYFEQMFGYKPGQLLGQYTQILYATIEQYEEVEQVNAERLKHGDLTPLEVKYKHRDGSIFSGLLSGYAIDSENPLKESVWTIINKD